MARVAAVPTVSGSCLSSRPDLPGLTSEIGRGGGRMRATPFSQLHSVWKACNQYLQLLETQFEFLGHLRPRGWPTFTFVVQLGTDAAWVAILVLASPH